jgi:hypothetical protein
MNKKKVNLYQDNTPAAQTAHLVLADTQANAEKLKELFLASAQKKTLKRL